MTTPRIHDHSSGTTDSSDPCSRVGGEETTLCLLSNLPTNQPPTNPTSNQPSYYLSVRVKVGHDKLDVLKSKVLYDVPSYCIYPHTTGGEHFHVCLPGLRGNGDSTRIGKRLRSHLGVSGNGGYSIKSHDNGLSSFIFYGGHEGSTAIYEDPFWRSLIEGTSVYYEKRSLVKAPMKERMSFPMLTYGNLLKQALKFRDEHRLTTSSLTNVLSSMVSDHNWQPSRDLLTNGVPKEIHEMFYDRVNNRKRSYSWMLPHEPSEEKRRFGTVIYHGPIHDPGLIQTGTL